VQAKWSPGELKELAHLEGVDLVVDPRELELDPGSEQELADDPQAQKNMELLRAISQRTSTGAPRRIHLRFRVSPVAIEGESGRVTGVCLERNRLVGEAGGVRASKGPARDSSLPAGLVVRAVGYRSLPLADLPFDCEGGDHPQSRRGVIDPASGEPLPGLYVAGWAKRGPTGLIGSNKPDGTETAMADARGPAAGHDRAARAFRSTSCSRRAEFAQSTSPPGSASTSSRSSAAAPPVARGSSSGAWRRCSRRSTKPRRSRSSQSGR
jgi:NADPH-dependent glutamate synthase beta subunit-like oxidoreductase